MKSIVLSTLLVELSPPDLALWSLNQRSEHNITCVVGASTLVRSLLLRGRHGFPCSFLGDFLAEAYEGSLNTNARGFIWGHMGRMGIL